MLQYGVSVSDSKIIDVLIIGSGGAGCSAALTASDAGKKVTLLTRTEFLDSKTSRAQGGVQAPIAEGDTPDKLYEDTLKAGEYLNDKSLTRLLADNAKEAIEWMINIGIKFDTNKKGEFLQRTAAGLSHPRILSCGDESGNRIMKPLIEAVSASEVNVVTYRTVTNIIKQKDLFHIESYDPRNNIEYEFVARTVILATGGGVPKEKRAGLSFMGDRPPPDSIELAEKIGLELESPELTQYHPTGIVTPKELRRKPIPELLRSMGAVLLNRKGEIFTDSMMTRKKLCDAIVEECEIGNGEKTKDGRIGVWLDTPQVDKINGSGYTAIHFSTLYNQMLKLGHDITKKRVLIYPIAHYTLGGIKIGPDCMTAVRGIFAAGEATWGVHGADRLMGNSLLEIFVFGRLAGQSAAKHIDSNTKLEAM